MDIAATTAIERIARVLAGEHLTATLMETPHTQLGKSTLFGQTIPQTQPLCSRRCAKLTRISNVPAISRFGIA
jgi:hypothetical protein